VTLVVVGCRPAAYLFRFSSRCGLEGSKIRVADKLRLVNSVQTTTSISKFSHTYPINVQSFRYFCLIWVSSSCISSHAPKGLFLRWD
jgi:hypothetical protein